MKENDISLDRTIHPEGVAAQKNVHRFEHEAMGTVYEIYIADQDKQYAAQAAHEGFILLDQLEGDLSKYVEGSDITRINVAAADTPVRVGQDAFDCLLACQEFFNHTNGIFDVTIGSLMQLWLNPDKSLRNPSKSEIEKVLNETGMDHLFFDVDDFSISKSLDSVNIDLGGYGKGYAVDEMATQLEEWDIENMLIHGGYSSVVSRGRMPGRAGWPVSITDPFTNKVLEKIDLENNAMCSSGLMKGSHIIDPRSGEPLKRKRATWVFTPDAAEGDALSTAFMVMDFEEIEQYIEDFPEVSVLIVSEEDGKKQVLRLGRQWD